MKKGFWYESSISQEMLLTSLRRQELIHRSTLILNPVENLPYPSDLAPSVSFLHGLYNTDSLRSSEEQINTLHQFAGRRRLAFDSMKIHSAFANALGAEDVSLRLLSGLHAHTVIFMAIAKPGQTVLLLPELAGGHMSTKFILERLGLRVIDMVTNVERHCIDIEKTIEVGLREKPDFIFVDRSEGLVYEDFGEIIEKVGGVSIYDASQYFTNILAGDHPNPFDVGFQFIISTLHKNFPGPQKALVAVKKADENWKKIKSGMSRYVSNMHVFNTYSAGLTLSRKDELHSYSMRMLDITVALDAALKKEGVNVISRPTDVPPTHHIWIHARDREHAFYMFKSLERCRILVNFRLLPYGIGFGLRLGLNSAARLGLTVIDTQNLALIISEIFQNGPGALQRHRARAFIEGLWKRQNASV